MDYTYEELKKKVQELEGLREKFLHAAADFENAKKRNARDKEDFIKFSQERILACAYQEYLQGRPGPGAIVIATFPGELDKSPLFAYEKGATMDGHRFVDDVMRRGAAGISCFRAYWNIRRTKCLTATANGLK